MKKYNCATIGAIIAEALWCNKIKTLFLLFCMIGAIFFGIVPPLVLEQAINLLIEKRMVPMTLALSYFACIAISGIFDASKEAMITVIGQKITHFIRRKMAEKLTRLPADYYEKSDSGVIVSKFVGDVDTLEKLFTSGIISMIVDVFKVLTIMYVIFRKSRGLGILLLFITPVLYLFTRMIQRRMFAAQLEHRKAVGCASQHIPETLKNIRTIHVLHKEKYMEARYDTFLQKGFAAMNRSNFYDAVYSPIIIAISSIIVAVMMVLSAKGDVFLTWFGMSVGTAVAVIAYVGKVFEPLENIGMEIQNIQSAMAGIRRISEFLNEKESAIVKESSISLRKVPVVISAANVTFGYEAGKAVLKNFSCSVEEGENVTLVGRTGVGKSTFFKLLLGLYVPDEGNVEILGIPAKDIPSSQKRIIFGYVEQSFHAIPGTIADQITLGDSAITPEMLREALKISGLYDAIMQLPKKELTKYQPNLFSQGQQQLLSIARAVVTNPRILLLDEITANLDSNTEAQVLQALQTASKNRTVLSISHRLYEQIGGRRIEMNHSVSDTVIMVSPFT